MSPLSFLIIRWLLTAAFAFLMTSGISFMFIGYKTAKVNFAIAVTLFAMVATALVFAHLK